MGSAGAVDAEGAQERAGGRPPDHERDLLLLRTGMPWRDLPERYGPYTTAYNRLSLVSAGHLEADFRHAGGEVAKSRDSLHLIDSTIVKAHRAASGAKGGSAIRRSGSAGAGARRKSTRSSTGKGRPLNFTVTAERCTTARLSANCSTPPGRRSPSERTRLTTAPMCASRPRMKAPCRSSRAAATPPRKLTVPSACTAAGTRSRTTSAASRTGGASPHATTNSHETSSPPQPWWAHSTGSGRESRP